MKKEEIIKIIKSKTRLNDRLCNDAYELLSSNECIELSDEGLMDIIKSRVKRFRIAFAYLEKKIG